MKAPAEFDDIFLGIELTEREARFLNWITGWDDYTIQNMRAVLEKVRSDVSEIRSENEKLKNDLARVKAERDAAISELECETIGTPRACDCCKHKENAQCKRNRLYGWCKWEWCGIRGADHEAAGN